MVFRHKNSTKMNYPYNITIGGETKEYVGRVGETLDFVCKADKKVFQTEDPDLLDSVLTVVCKTDRYYTVPSSGVREKSVEIVHFHDWFFLRTGQYVRPSVIIWSFGTSCPRRTQSWNFGWSILITMFGLQYTLLSILLYNFLRETNLTSFFGRTKRYGTSALTREMRGSFWSKQSQARNSLEIRRRQVLTISAWRQESSICQSKTFQDVLQNVRISIIKLKSKSQGPKPQKC